MFFSDAVFFPAPKIECVSDVRTFSGIFCLALVGKKHLQN